MKLLIVLFFILAYPISKLLDCCLGHDHEITRYRREELSAFIKMHAPGKASHVGASTRVTVTDTTSAAARAAASHGSKVSDVSGVAGVLTMARAAAKFKAPAKKQQVETESRTLTTDEVDVMTGAGRW